jgi:hypothetical protein
MIETLFLIILSKQLFGRGVVGVQVRLALEEYKASEAAAAQAAPPVSANVAALTAEVEAERGARRRLEGEVAEWAAAVEAKEAELANLQLALGELSYESEGECARNIEKKTEVEHKLL